MDLVLSTLGMLAQGVTGVVLAGITVILIILALVRKETGLMVIAALLTVPFAYLWGAWGGFLLAVRLLPLFPLLSAVAINSEEPIFAWILPMPAVAFLLYFVFNSVVTGFNGI
ncbi:MAG TPA: hypothetical protein PKL78_13290 [Anaerolineales bacterium]|nr:hypothetical protein [Anaerolineales bacterium]HNO30234.1 hypothetical protein [Anaerolineales bacterium]